MGQAINGELILPATAMSLDLAPNQRMLHGLRMAWGHGNEENRRPHELNKQRAVLSALFIFQSGFICVRFIPQITQPLFGAI